MEGTVKNGCRSGRGAGRMTKERSLSRAKTPGSNCLPVGTRRHHSKKSSATDRNVASWLLRPPGGANLLNVDAKIILALTR